MDDIDTDDARAVRITLGFHGRDPESRVLRHGDMTARLDGPIRRATGSPLRVHLSDSWGQDSILAVWWAAGQILGRTESLDALLDIPTSAVTHADIEFVGGADPEAANPEA